jgi:hypothetical protein
LFGEPGSFPEVRGIGQELFVGFSEHLARPRMVRLRRGDQLGKVDGMQ